ncbi:MAG TPA: CUAEP/CCAEP-tail radical SAM protein [Nitrospirales bacterium]|nr:CUAEP/CCAEP-tail radical SAM protein [Nitrospirales bacterium]
MRQQGAVLLVSCYELGHQPIGISLPIGFLEQAGYAPASLDIAVEKVDLERITQARFLGISVPMHTALRLGVRVAELVREGNPSCHICFYGLYASLNAKYLLGLFTPAHPRRAKTRPFPFADSVIGGEYEAPLVQLIETLERGDSLEEVEGVSHREKIVGPYLKRLPFAVPNRNGLPALERYAHLERDGVQHVVGYVEASRGCLHQCLHCPIVPVYEGRFFIVPQEVVLEDVRRQVQAGATHITFGDPDFLNGPGHSLSIVRAMRAEFPHVTFDFTAKIEHILKHRVIFSELGSLGCLFVISAVESFSDLVLTKLEKGHTRADVFAALEIVRQAGITLRASLVPFTPWATLDDYLEMFDVVESHDLIDATDPVQYTIRLLIPPGSALLARSDVHRFLGPLDQAGFQYQWTHPDPRMDKLHQEVSAAVEAAASTGEDPMATFDRLRAITYRFADLKPPAPTASRTLSRDRRRPPRLTEPWFCCAEPTESQLRPLHTKGYGEV